MNDSTQTLNRDNRDMQGNALAQLPITVPGMTMVHAVICVICVICVTRQLVNVHLLWDQRSIVLSALAWVRADEASPVLIITDSSSRQALHNLSAAAPWSIPSSACHQENDKAFRWPSQLSAQSHGPDILRVCPNTGCAHRITNPLPLQSRQLSLSNEL